MSIHTAKNIWYHAPSVKLGIGPDPYALVKILIESDFVNDQLTDIYDQNYCVNYYYKRLNN